MKTKTPSTNGALDRLLEPLARSLTPEAARALVDMRIDRQDRKRIAELAKKCNEGNLSASERQEYEDYVRGGDLISILQSKARQYLSTNSQS